MAQRDEKGRFVRTKPDYKAMYEGAKISIQNWENSFLKLYDKLEFLYNHAPFWLRWMYNRKFKKGGSK